jgi:hypothetical protein
VCGFVLTNLGHDSLTRSRAWGCDPLQQGAPCQLSNQILKDKPSLSPDLLLFAFSLQVVDVNLLKSPLNAYRKLIFNQGRSPASLAEKEIKKQEVLWQLSATTQTVTYTSRTELRTPSGNCLEGCGVRCQYVSTC